MDASSTHAVRSDRWVAPAVGAGAVLLGACVVAALVDPSGGPTICPLKAATGLDCPLCGATRAVHHALRGDIATAAGFNVLVVVALPFLLIVAYLVLARAFGTGWRLPAVRLPRSLVVAGAVVVGAFWVARNLPIAPLSALGT